MSSAATKDLITRYYEAFNAGDLEGMVGCVSADVRHDVNQGARREGREAFRAFCDHMQLHYEETLTDLVIFAEGSRAAAEFMVMGRYLATEAEQPDAAGQRYALPAGAFFEVRGGEITRVTTYYNLGEWRRQIAEGAPA